MRRDRLALAALVALLAQGCMTVPSHVWTKPGSTDAQQARDRYECWYEAQSIPRRYVQVPTPPGIPPVPGFDVTPTEAVRGACLQARGYQKSTP